MTSSRMHSRSQNAQTALFSSHQFYHFLHKSAIIFSASSVTDETTHLQRKRQIDGLAPFLSDGLISDYFNILSTDLLGSLNGSAVINLVIHLFGYLQFNSLCRLPLGK